MKMSGQLHAPAALTPGMELPVSNGQGGLVGLRASLDAVAKRKIPSLPLPGTEPRSSRPFPCHRNVSASLVSIKI